MSRVKNLIQLVSIAFLLGCGSDERMFTLMDSNHTQVDFSNDITESEAFNINQYMYIYNGGGIAVGDINNDGLTDVYFGANQKSNKLYLNKGDFKFEDITEKAQVGGPAGESVWTTGVSMVDINHDGWLDIYVNQISNFKHIRGRNRLYINNGDETFSEQAAKYGLDLESFSQQCIFFDYDLDGDLDMYQVNHSIHDLDVYVKSQKRLIRDSLAGDRLFRNDDDFFVDVSEESGIYGGATGYGLAVAVSDLDGNGCPDIYVSNDFHENDYLYYNQCDGTFKEGISNSMPYVSTFSMGNDITDVNNDGLMDIITLDMKPEDEVVKRSSSGPDPWDVYNFKLSFGYHYQYPRNMLHINRGNLLSEEPSFSEVGQQAGIDATDWSWSVLSVDLDNDLRKDVFITNGIERRLIDLDYINYVYNEESMKTISAMELVKKMPDGRATNYAYQNAGESGYEDVSEKWGLNYTGYSTGSAYADLNNDGYQDLIVNNLNSPSVIYQNNGSSLAENNYLKIELKGSEMNTYGIGAKVTLEVEGEILTQEMSPVRGWLSSSDPTLIFGLGKNSKVDKLTVRWADGRKETLTGVPCNQTIKLQFSDAKKVESNPGEEVKLLSKIEVDNITYKHAEDEFVDFNVERLIPHKLSNEGPKITVGDVNDDGKEDFFVGGAAGYAGEMYVQTTKEEGFFKKADIDVLEQDRSKEDVDAVFFDADRDGDQDLYVVSGGAHANEGRFLEDRLYINNGNLTFERSANIPVIDVNGSCVVAEDFNNDGSIDLFVGGRSVYSSYGIKPKSYLLWNDGSGNFAIDNSEQASLFRDLGMVTDASWVDGLQTLFVVGEWMPITQITFGDNSISKSEIENTSGWWNTIYAADLDNDGDQDFLVGNAGKNIDLDASPEKPVRLIVNDWDKNSSTDPIITHYNQGEEWIYASLDELIKQMPAIKNRYQSYTLYANHPLNKMFTESDLSKASIRKVETFESIILWNKGDGDFSVEALPDELQISPTYSFYADDLNNDNQIDFLSAGNFYGNSPMLGRSASSFGRLLTGLGEGEFRIMDSKQSGFIVPGQARDIKKIEVEEEEWFIVSRNDETLLFYR